jgi:hypothetical protein
MFSQKHIISLMLKLAQNNKVKQTYKYTMTYACPFLTQMIVIECWIHVLCVASHLHFFSERKITISPFRKVWLYIPWKWCTFFVVKHYGVRYVWSDFFLVKSCLSGINMGTLSMIRNKSLYVTLIIIQHLWIHCTYKIILSRELGSDSRDITF